MLLGYRLGRDGRYRQIKPDAQGRLLSEATGLLFGVGEEGQTPIIFEAQTGERLLDPKEQADREAIRSFLQNPVVKGVAAKAGVSMTKAESAVSTLQGDELRQAAAQARAANNQLVGGATVVITTTTIIIILLVIIIIIALAD